MIRVGKGTVQATSSREENALLLRGLLRIDSEPGRVPLLVLTPEGRKWLSSRPRS